MLKTNIKLVIAGSVVEVYLYERPVSYGVRLGVEERDKKPRILREDDDALRRSALHSKKQVRRWIDANAWQWLDQFGKPCFPKFATFTFKENITDLPSANYFFGKFMKRFNYSLGFKESILKYIVVHEPQKRGAIHYHCLFFNLPFIDDLPEKLSETWQYGFVRVKAVDRVKNLAAYITKYMTKDMQNFSWKGKRRYFVSKGLLKPFDVHAETTAHNILRALVKLPVIARGNWESEFAGKIEYMKIDLGRGNTIDDVPIDKDTKAILNAIKLSQQ